VVAQPDERHANRTASVLKDMTDTDQSTSGSNEVIVVAHITKLVLIYCWLLSEQNFYLV